MVLLRYVCFKASGERVKSIQFFRHWNVLIIPTRRGPSARAILRPANSLLFRRAAPKAHRTTKKLAAKVCERGCLPYRCRTACRATASAKASCFFICMTLRCTIKCRRHFIFHIAFVSGVRVMWIFIAGICLMFFKVGKISRKTERVDFRDGENTTLKHPKNVFVVHFL